MRDKTDVRGSTSNILGFLKKVCIYICLKTPKSDSEPRFKISWGVIHDCTKIQVQLDAITIVLELLLDNYLQALVQGVEILEQEIFEQHW